MLYATIHKEGCLIEDSPTDTAVALDLDERASKLLAALTSGLLSYELSYALGQLWMSGVREGQKASRRRTPKPVTSA